MLRQLCNSLRLFAKPTLLIAVVWGCCLSGCQLFQQPEADSALRQATPKSGFREPSNKPSWNRGGWSPEAQEIEKSLGL
jgi:hypothetical protein